MRLLLAALLTACVIPSVSWAASPAPRPVDFPVVDWAKAIESARVANKPLLVQYQMVMR